MIIPIIIPIIKGILHPHKYSVSKNIKLTNSAKIHPNPPEKNIIEVPKEILSFWQCSVKNTEEFEVSAPAHIPCNNLAQTSTTGAIIPICSYVGHRPIAPVAREAQKIVKIKPVFLPYLSAIYPINNAPKGRAM